MPNRPLLYLDVDETLIAECFSGSGFDLRPGVATQIKVLTRLFDCCWLTHWKESDLVHLWTDLYAGVVANIRYGDWKERSTSQKAPYVLANSHNFYWLEDKLSTGSLKPLEEAGLMDRYIPVESKGLWGFTRALRVLFDRAGIKAADIKAAGGQPAWFNEPLGDHFDWIYYEWELK